MTLRRTSRITAMAILLGSMTSPAAAQVANTQLQGIGLELGTVNGGSTDLGTRWSLAVDLGTVWKPWIDLSASVGSWSADLAELGRDRTGDVSAVNARGIGRVAVRRGAARWYPHILGGLGLHRVRVDIPDDDALDEALDGTRISGELGLGATYQWKRNLNARGELSRVMMSDFSHWGVNAGLYWNFRGGNPTSMMGGNRAVSRVDTREKSTSAAKNSSSSSKSMKSTKPTSKAGSPWASESAEASVSAMRESSAKARADEASTLSDIRFALDEIGRRITTAERERELAIARAANTQSDRVTSTEARAALMTLFTDEAVDVDISADRAQIHVRPAALRFAHGSTELTEPGKALLARIGRVLRTYSRVQVIVEGHTDKTGSWQSNVWVARKRAEAVQNELKAHEVSTGRLSILSLGSGTPLDPKSTRAARAANRRVELRFFLVD